ncbi:MAG: metalloregulator ArsR/SmtB family transcription factor [Chloroflexi bacterium]|nr:metalloregulator ArsR/SmtB family transcription factor [Ardenticatenaceae bacterium]MBL1129080.1 ArsR family transcriptional regulator [Chloroflexota bacterium]NOG35160.1 metalloregulator ArsR/SmtB family transcription factor [Chloroflexota bacterium]GIK54574.1 MAG: ArsR family transcriptional regulator [Chloroflexota bacterium]
MAIFLAEPPHVLKLLAHTVRWQIVAALAQSDCRVQELETRLARPQNLVSYHLRLLREGGLVGERRSSADGRDAYYTLNLDSLRSAYQASGAALHPALACVANPKIVRTRPYRVLFLCTHNSARSQLAEGILRAAGGERVEVFSAGNQVTAVHPLAIRAAAERGLDISQQRAKHLDEFAGQLFDAVITVCDRVREVCPVFPGDPPHIHWSLPDPTAVTGPENEQYQAFLNTAHELATRIDYWLKQL